MNRMVFCIIPLIMVIMGCASSGTTVEETKENSPGKDFDAAKLAADINAIRPGSAEVNGSTVTIVGGFVEIQNGLTVPEGVTLEVTAGGSALGLRDSILTVNGTVNAGPNYIRLEDRASWAVINGNGIIRLKGQGNLLYVEGNKNAASRKLTVDGVTLVGVGNNSESLVSIKNGGEFVLKSGAITGNANTNTNADGSGGGVRINEGGTFIMEGGEISGNTTEVNGGGVFVSYNGTFTMEGGTISGNTAAYGGGVRNRGGSTFTMKGGRIQGNTDSDGFTKNIATGDGVAVLSAGSAKWGMGGTYTRGGVSQTGGSDIAPIKDRQGSTDDTLIAAP
jgi:hypothetical protein